MPEALEMQKNAHVVSAERSACKRPSCAKRRAALVKLANKSHWSFVGKIKLKITIILNLDDFSKLRDRAKFKMCARAPLEMKPPDEKFKI